MDGIWWLAWALVVLGFIGTLLPLLPGVPVLFAGLLLAAWHEGFTKVSVLSLCIIGIFACLAWAVDFFGSYITAKKVGASKQALWGVAIGALLGLAGGIVGIIIGPAIGAMVGEWLAYKDNRRAATVGVAAGLGFILAFVLKFLLVLVMLSVFAYAYYV
jgi:uncharacterized protein YqgC (DUF456 family)